MSSRFYTFFAFVQGWTSTAWLLASAQLVTRHGSAIFTAALSHFFACGILAAMAAAGNAAEVDGWRRLRHNAGAVPRRVAFLGGLGWTSSLVMVAASPSLGVAVAQVLVVSGEMLTAAAFDVCFGGKTQRPFNTAAACGLVVLGVALNVLNEFTFSKGGGKDGLVFWIFAAFGCGMCLVLNSVSNAHLRQYIGTFNASAWSALVASLGNAAIWLFAEVADVAHFRWQADPQTMLLWAVIGGASSYMVFIVTFVPQEIGFALTFCCIVAGKISAGLLVDTVGFMGAKREVTWERGAGMTLVFLGALLLKLPSLRDIRDVSTKGRSVEESQRFADHDANVIGCGEEEQSTELAAVDGGGGAVATVGAKGSRL
eukprot:TRINITY_DN83677_c0_g1_i1.p1 TRINITY_DN83677_c0_g1~~TRINITY_DN83677_c0_g1_i1.p1  ORF type:complete len:370 (+),score=87.40 TRINITY_DN83677_c0_g1_i1:52-1161(+)